MWIGDCAADHAMPTGETPWCAIVIRSYAVAMADIFSTSDSPPAQLRSGWIMSTAPASMKRLKPQRVYSCSAPEIGMLVFSRTFL